MPHTNPALPPMPPGAPPTGAVGAAMSRFVTAMKMSRNVALMSRPWHNLQGPPKAKSPGMSQIAS